MKFPLVEDAPTMFDPSADAVESFLRLLRQDQVPHGRVLHLEDPGRQLLAGLLDVLLLGDRHLEPLGDVRLLDVGEELREPVHLEAVGLPSTPADRQRDLDPGAVRQGLLVLHELDEVVGVVGTGTAGGVRHTPGPSRHSEDLVNEGGHQTSTFW